MAWTELTFSFGSTLDAAKMNQLQANFTAITAGDAGAPKFQGDAFEDLLFASPDISKSSGGGGDVSVGAGATYTFTGPGLHIATFTTGLIYKSEFLRNGSWLIYYSHVFPGNGRSRCTNTTGGALTLLYRYS